jgi:hypothetical protein
MKAKYKQNAKELQEKHLGTDVLIHISLFY